MNYRHAFHAGNFADVLKHIILVRVVEYFKRKPAPFRVIDTHAGIGVYDLDGEAARKTDEWRAGIEKIYRRTFSPAVAELFQPYLDGVGAENQDGNLQFYPGSPKLVSRLLRPDDRLIVNELHSEDAALLRRTFSSSRQVKVMSLDGWTALKALLPPKERRGITLIDPPFEQPGEFDRLVKSVIEQQRRFATGAMILWYPIKDRQRVAAFYRQISALKVASCLVCELAIDQINGDGPVRATGMILINPPYPLHDELKVILPVLCTSLGQTSAATHDVRWLARA